MLYLLFKLNFKIFVKIIFKIKNVSNRKICVSNRKGTVLFSSKENDLKIGISTLICMRKKFVSDSNFLCRLIEALKILSNSISTYNNLVLCIFVVVLCIFLCCFFNKHYLVWKSPFRFNNPILFPSG